MKNECTCMNSGSNCFTGNCSNCGLRKKQYESLNLSPIFTKEPNYEFLYFPKNSSIEEKTDEEIEMTHINFLIKYNLL